MSDSTQHISAEANNANNVEKISFRTRAELYTRRSTDVVLRRAQAELQTDRLEGNAQPLMETQVRHLEKVEIEKSGTPDLHRFNDVQRISPRFQTAEQIASYRDQAWQRFVSSPEGKLLINQAGGKEQLVTMMNDGQHNFVTRAATLCEKAGLSDHATGRTVHRLAELHTLEKHGNDVLSGGRHVEQRIDYIDRNGEHRHVELDDVTHLPDGRVVIRDYKPINLSHFERTKSGSEWAKWAEETIGRDFREQIQAGVSPFFNELTRGSMPTSIRASLQGYLKEVTHHHQAQLEKYKDLYSAATGVDRANIRTAVEPYFKFSGN